MPDKGSIFNNESDLEEIRKRIKEIQKEKEESYKKSDVEPQPEAYYGDYCKPAMLQLTPSQIYISKMLQFVSPVWKK